MAYGKTKLSVMVDVKTADKIDKLARCWNMSLSGVIRFMIKHYLRFGITGLKSEGLEGKVCRKQN